MCPHILIELGLVLCSLGLLGGGVAFLVFSKRRKAIQRQLEEEYGQEVE